MVRLFMLISLLIGCSSDLKPKYRYSQSVCNIDGFYKYYSGSIIDYNILIDYKILLYRVRIGLDYPNSKDVWINEEYLSLDLSRCLTN